MNGRVQVVTLKIDGQDVSARRDETILWSPAKTASRSPRSVIWKACRVGRVPVVPGGDQGHSQAPARLRDVRERGDGSDDRMTAAV